MLFLAHKYHKLTNKKQINQEWGAAKRTRQTCLNETLFLKTARKYLGHKKLKSVPGCHKRIEESKESLQQDDNERDERDDEVEGGGDVEPGT